MPVAYDKEFDNLIIFSEVKRVLRPGGLYLFVEHVAAKGNRFEVVVGSFTRQKFLLGI